MLAISSVQLPKLAFQPAKTSRRRQVQCSAVSSVIDFKKSAQLALSTAAASFALICPMPSIAACPDYISSPSGLQYCDSRIGSGEAPVKGAFIKAHYEGRLDSKQASGVFDSSYDRGRPLAFSIGVGQVIRGWDLGILGDGDAVTPMLPGGKRSLIIPPELGYGERGAGGVIPPNATLYFDVELVGQLGKK